MLPWAWRRQQGFPSVPEANCSATLWGPCKTWVWSHLSLSLIASLCLQGKDQNPHVGPGIHEQTGSTIFRCFPLVPPPGFPLPSFSSRPSLPLPAFAWQASAPPSPARPSPPHLTGLRAAHRGPLWPQRPGDVPVVYSCGRASIMTRAKLVPGYEHHTGARGCVCALSRS